MSYVDKLMEKFAIDQKVALVQIKVVTVTPLTVRIGGGTVAVPARQIEGQVLNVNDLGLALWASPGTPICFKTI